VTFILGSLSGGIAQEELHLLIGSSGHWQKALNPADGSVKARMHYARSILTNASQPSYARLILQCSYCVGNHLSGVRQGENEIAYLEVNPGDGEGLTALRAVTICLPTASETRGMEDIINFFLWKFSC